MSQLIDESFTFNRARGIVWVCDIKNSSKYLNNSKYVDYLEEFLIRFHWISRRIVHSSGGQYIKWTGDGFLAWYECPLKRNLSSITDLILDAVWHMTFITNITQMGLTNDIRISIRNSIAFEEDALITYITSKGNSSLDILGRSVVLCFRLSSIPSKFPNIIIHGDLINNDSKYKITKIIFDEKEIDKYFKGENWQTDNIYEINIRQKNDKPIETIDSIDLSAFHINIQKELENGPGWSKELLKMYIDFLKNMKELIAKFNNELH